MYFRGSAIPCYSLGVKQYGLKMIKHRTINDMAE